MRSGWVRCYASLNKYLQICTVSRDGKISQICLDKEDRIRNPTYVNMSNDGKRLIVINNGGYEILSYLVGVG